MKRRLGLGVALAVLPLLGCPAEDRPEPPPLPPPTLKTPAPTEEPPEDRPVTPDPDAPDDPSESLSREQLLALEPADVLSEGLRGEGALGLAPRVAGEGTLALAEQLRAEEAPMEAIALCMVAFDQARDELAPDDEVPEKAHKRLRRTLGVQSEGFPRLQVWVLALSEHAIVKEDLDACVAFLDRARKGYELILRLRSSPPK